jgi:hypothetical protein
MKSLPLPVNVTIVGAIIESLRRTSHRACSTSKLTVHCDARVPLENRARNLPVEQTATGFSLEYSAAKT